MVPKEAHPTVSLAMMFFLTPYTLLWGRPNLELFKMLRNGCRMECLSGDECCVECRELELMRELWGG